MLHVRVTMTEVCTNRKLGIYHTLQEPTLTSLASVTGTPGIFSAEHRMGGRCKVNY